MEIEPQATTPVTADPVIKPRKERGKLWLWVLAILLVAGAIYGVWWWQQRTINGLKDRVSQLEQQAAQLTPNQEVAVSNTTTKFVSLTGKFNMQYPSDWLTLVCEGNESTVFLAPDEESQALCASEKFSPVLFSSQAGDQRSLKTASVDEYASEVKITDVTLNGVAGKKATYVLDGNEFAQAGTKVTQYEFFTAGRTYIASYNQLPSGDDLANDFEAMVKTWKFSIN